MTFKWKYTPSFLIIKLQLLQTAPLPPTLPISPTMPVSFASASDKQSTSQNPSDVRSTGTAGAASLEAINYLQENEIGTRTRIGASSDGVVPALQSQQPAMPSGNAPSERQLTKDEADRLYEENIEDEYAKREGGAWFFWDSGK